MTAARPRRLWISTATLAVVVLTLALALSLAGPWGGAAAAGDSARASKAASVDIANFAFHPPTLRVAKGSKVVFSNSSGVKHTATRAGSFDTGKIKPGRSVSVRFGQRGNFAYHCTIHPFMHGKIVVE